MDEEAARPFDSEDNALIEMLLKEYPVLDQMQAETLVWAYKTNNLGVLAEWVLEKLLVAIIYISTQKLTQMG